MSIVITGASGHFGRAATALLLKTTASASGPTPAVPPSLLILISRTPESLAPYRNLGCQVRYGDFDDPASLARAFRGARTMLLISSMKVGARVAQHGAAIAAAQAAGVQRIVYTSFCGADPASEEGWEGRSIESDDEGAGAGAGEVRATRRTALVVREHAQTERLLQRSGLRWTALRDSQYADALLEAAAPMAMRAGVFPSNCGGGRNAPVVRADCVACAVEVLKSHFAASSNGGVSPYDNTVLNMAGPENLTWLSICRLWEEFTGVGVEYKQVTDDEMYAFFDQLGIPRKAGANDEGVGGYKWCSDDMVSFSKAIRMGEMEVPESDVEKVLGRKPRSLRQLMETQRELFDEMGREAKEAR